MLHFKSFTSNKTKLETLKNFNPRHHLWISPDSKSRLLVLNHLQCHYPVLNNQCVLRAKDFWQHLLEIQKPGFYPLSKNFLSVVYKNWAEQSHLKPVWKSSIRTSSLVCECMEVFSHMMLHKERHSLMEEWLKEAGKPDFTRHYLHLAESFWDYLYKKKVFDPGWAASMLLDHLPAFKLQKWGHITFDLGWDMDLVEAELIVQIASKTSVCVVLPFPFPPEGKTQNSFFSTTAYKIFTAQGKSFFSKNKSPVVKEGKALKPVCVKGLRSFLSPLAEAKDITSWAKKLLKKGVKPEDIALLCPHIEEYWPVLSFYFQIESIPVSKREKTTLLSFPQITFWLANLYTHSGHVQYENLELLKSRKHPNSDFSRFENHFLHITDKEHIPSHLLTKNLIKDFNQKLSPEGFLDWSLKLYTGDLTHQDPDQEEEDFLLPHIQNILGELVAFGTHFKKSFCIADWILFLEFRLKETEIVHEEEHTKGINCVSLNAINQLSPSYVYAAGLSEQNLKENDFSQTLEFDTEFLRDHLGFFLKTKTPHNKEQSLLSFTKQDSLKEVVFSFSRSDFQGDPLSPSYLWLKEAREQNLPHPLPPHTPGMTLQDHYQNQDTVSKILQHKNFTEEHLKELHGSLQEDKGKRPLKKLVPSFQKKQFSASLLESYAQCPFIALSKHFLRLSSGQEQDVDIPSTLRGTTTHRLFEYLSQPPPPPDPDTILDWIEATKTDILKEFKTLHPLVWEKEKQHFFQKAKLFLEHEKQLQSFFNQEGIKPYKTLKREFEFQCYWDSHKLCLSQKGDLLFKGIVDRVDGNGSSYRIVDYKPTLPSEGDIHAWGKSKKFQMALYMQALELGLTELKPLPVNYALYFSYKDFKYRGGALKDSLGMHLLQSRRAWSLFKTKEEKSQILKSLNQQIQNVFLNIREGDFQPQPLKQQLCQNCQWRDICRLPQWN